MCVVVVKEVGEGFSGIKKKRGRMTKGGRRDEEHEVGLDKTMDLQVTFELLSVRRPDYGFVGKDSVEESVFSPKDCSRFEAKSLVTHAIMS